MQQRLIVMCMVLSLATAGLTGCASSSNQQKGTGVGAATGAGVGAILGQVIGQDTESTLLGAGIGAAVGGLAGNQIGRYMDQQEEDLRRVAAQSEATSINRSRDVLRATFGSEVLFDFDSATIKPGGQAEISRVAEVLKQYPKTTIRVEGHTDKSGPEEYNQRLSERRAQAVKKALVQQGVQEIRITAVGYGETQPVSSSAAANRRVEVVIEPIRKG
ncbi:OmpA family protein [Desulfovermiculus halophilus]|jgi:outer membrane protein OmpA-like peptidoglycan-associated protein|uniref:OmpA family protein n=1 Tax=Desulfovermiculus halophilus TaxID=339722 RepID=UPI000489C55F|nr:OmpA family protein [Desulfovermiculus halophilus]